MSNGERIAVDITTSPIFEQDEFEGYFGIMREATPNFRRHRYFRERPPRHPGRNAFIAMPYDSDLVPEDVWKVAIKEAVEGNGLSLVRSDRSSLRGTRVVDEIFSDIWHATLVVGDLTGGNPNVFYEIGLAHALDKTVILLNRRGDEIPFDVKGIHVIEYEIGNLWSLRDELSEAIRQVIRSEEKFVPKAS